MLRAVKSSQRLPRQLSFKVTGTGSPAINVGQYDATLVRNSTGNYTLTFVKAFARVPVVVATAQTSTCYAEISAATATACTIITKSNADVLTDAIFNVIVMGFDTSDEVSGA